MPRIMKNKCQDVSAHSRAVIVQLDVMVNCLAGPMYQESFNELCAKAGERHANLGMQQKHYFLLGEAMLSTLEYFLKTSSGYWKRVQSSWDSFFHAMFEVMKIASKKEGMRQDMLLKASKRSERQLKLSPPQKTCSLNTVDTTISDSSTEFDASPDSPRNLGSDELMDLRMDKKSSRSMRNLMANQLQGYDIPLQAKSSRNFLSSSSHDPSRRKQMPKTRPASMRNLFAGGSCSRTPEPPSLRKMPLERSSSGEKRSVQSMRIAFAAGGDCPQTPEQPPPMQKKSLERNNSSDKRSVAMRNLLSSPATNSPSIDEEDKDDTPRRGRLLQSLLGGHKGYSHANTSEIPPPPPSCSAPSPRSIVSPATGRPCLNRSSSTRRDCAVFTMDTSMMMTPNSRHSKKVESPRHPPKSVQEPQMLTIRRMRKGGIKEIMMHTAAGVIPKVE
jgi:hypothetical protein